MHVADYWLQVTGYTWEDTWQSTSACSNSEIYVLLLGVLDRKQGSVSVLSKPQTYLRWETSGGATAVVPAVSKAASGAQCCAVVCCQATCDHLSCLLHSSSESSLTELCFSKFLRLSQPVSPSILSVVSVPLFMFYPF